MRHIVRDGTRRMSRQRRHLVWTVRTDLCEAGELGQRGVVGGNSLAARAHTYDCNLLCGDILGGEMLLMAARIVAACLGGQASKR